DWRIAMALWAFHRVIGLRGSGFRAAGSGFRVLGAGAACTANPESQIPNPEYARPPNPESRIPSGVLLGLFIAVQAWSSLYYAVFLVTALAILSVVMLIGRPLDHIRALAVPLLVGAVVCAVLVGPYAAIYSRAASSLGHRTRQDVSDWSPNVHHYLVSEPENWLHGRRWHGESLEMYLFPGLTAMFAAVVGLWPPLNRTRLGYGVLLVLAFDLSLGVNGITYPAAYRMIGVYRGLRVPARMFVIVSAAMAVAGAHGAARLLRRTARPAFAVALGAACVSAVLIESASMPISLAPVNRTAPSIYSWLKRQPPSVVLEWPMPKPWTLGYTHEPLYMYYSIGHWQRLVNGYSGFYPGSYLQLLEATATFPSSEAIEYLRR